MSGDEFHLRGVFPEVSYEDWRAVAEADLEGAAFEQKLVTRTYEGIDVQPLYSRRDQPGEGDVLGFPGQFPFVRGSTSTGPVVAGWDLRQEHFHPDVVESNRAILDDLSGGVTSIHLRLDECGRNGLDPDDSHGSAIVGRDGVMLYRLDEFRDCLKSVSLERIPVGLDGGAAFLPAAALLVSLWRSSGVDASVAKGAFNADPIGVLARDGHLPYTTAAGLRQLAELATWTSANAPNVTSVAVDTSPYHHAGATSVQDLAFGVATGIEYLRAMMSGGLGIDAAARQIVFDMSVGTHHFLAIAKLRAARRMWSRVIQACGGSPSSGAMRIQARTSKRVLTRRDPYVNLLRNTVAMFAAGVAGAEILTPSTFDVMIGLPDTFSRRIARNTVLILQEEAHLNRVLDPSGGSWFLDRLTEQVADGAWTLLQTIESQGGMLASLTSGWVSNQIDAGYASRAKDIAKRKEGITGVSEFPNVREEKLQHPVVEIGTLRDRAVKGLRGGQGVSRALPESKATAVSNFESLVDAASAGASVGHLSKLAGLHREHVELTPLKLRSLAEPFEELRDASDAWREKRGKGPSVFLANMGPIAHHTARATFSKNFFEAGGFEVVTNDGFRDADLAARAFVESGASIAVICSSDKLYPEVVPVVAGKLKNAGAKLVVLAGNPGANEAAWRTAGVDRFIFIKCDVLAMLRDMLRVLGVIPEGVAKS